jgi:hypothetical protein
MWLITSAPDDRNTETPRKRYTVTCQWLDMGLGLVMGFVGHL